VERVPLRSADRAVGRFARWSGWRRPAARLSLTSVAAVALLLTVGVVGGYLVPALAARGVGARPAANKQQALPTGVPGSGLPGAGTPRPAAPTESASPGVGATPQATSGPTALAAWAAPLDKLGIPRVALEAYGYAELTTAQTTPSCHLSWTTLAGIGKIESNHGTHGGSTLLSDGMVTPPIYGPPLDGSNDNKLIRDTDQGQLDSDKMYDRAVGPMQFLPSTWKHWGTDADGDGHADPQDINDAALSAARYLCADGHNLSTGAGWWQAIHSYNDLDKYASDVFAAADAYGLASRG
jgi:membrane-bound lytic murein transglycosylase B